MHENLEVVFQAIRLVGVVLLLINQLCELHRNIFLFRDF